MISWKSYLFCENQINFVIVLDLMSPIYTFFFNVQTWKKNIKLILKYRYKSIMVKTI